MLKVFNSLLQLVTTQMCGYEILCSNGARRGREIIINPVVGCFSIRQLAVFLLFPWNNCDKGYCHGCFTKVVTVVSLLWNKCDNRLGTSVTTVLEQLCQMGIQFTFEYCNQIMTVWGVLLYIENGLFY